MKRARSKRLPRPPANNRELARVRPGDLADGCFAIDDAGGIVGFAPPVRDELIARGVLAPRDGWWRIGSANVGIVSEGRYGFLAVCDFCSARPVVWDIDCGSFSFDHDECLSKDGFVACAECGSLVEANDRAGLLRRAATSLENRRASAGLCRGDADVLAMIRELQQKFWQHRGAMRPIPARSYGH